METLGDLTRYLSTLPNPPEKYKVAVGSLIFTPEDELILLERGTKARDAVGKLEGVGGGIDDGETNLHDVLKREIREEIGIEVTIDDVLTVKILPGTKYPFWVVVDYLCRLQSGEPTIREPGKIKAIHLLSVPEIKDSQLSKYQLVAMSVYRQKFGTKPYYKNE